MRGKNFAYTLSSTDVCTAHRLTHIIAHAVWDICIRNKYPTDISQPICVTNIARIVLQGKNATRTLLSSKQLLLKFIFPK